MAGIIDWFKDTFDFGGDDDDTYDIGSYFDPPTGTVNPWDIFNTDYSGVGGGMPAGDDTYGIGEGYGNAFDFGNDSYTDLSLDDLFNFNSDYSDDPWGIGEGYGDAFDFSDDDNNAFNEFLLNFDFDDPDADWAGGIGDLFDFGDPDDPYGIGAGYDDAFGDSGGDLSIDELISLFGTGGNGNGNGNGETGPLGGKWGPLLRNFFLGSGGTGGNKQGGIMGLLNSLLGGGDGGGGLLGGGGLGTLAALWALNKARKEGSDPGAVIPMGQQAYGMDDVYGGPTPDYRVFNIQPALMPGVAYANVGKPEGMKGGGIKDGPGDVTPAWLEPGEFVMTKKATGNIGAQNLYKMMKEAEGRG